MAGGTTSNYPYDSASANWPGMLLVGGAHAVLTLALLSWAPASAWLTTSAPIMVAFIAPAALPSSAARPRPQPPTELVTQPRHIEPTPLAPMPLLTVPAPEASPVAPPPTPLVSTTNTTAAPVPAVPAVQAAALRPSVPSAPPAAIAPPRFDAEYLNNPPPAYPSMARRLREQGRVVLRVLVSIAGDAERVEVRTSSGSARLDEAARDTVKRWRFVPARQGAEAVAAWVLVPISFALEG